MDAFIAIPGFLSYISFKVLMAMRTASFAIFQNNCVYSRKYSSTDRQPYDDMTSS
ncbi:hypothetical protein PHSC3_000359 [Chlamydiales bacterium STE3]|nr:hypothetical protein PHSC3_000359 [Chlamydiales bacterium STE3]